MCTFAVGGWTVLRLYRRRLSGCDAAVRRNAREARLGALWEGMIYRNSGDRRIGMVCTQGWCAVCETLVIVWPVGMSSLCCLEGGRGRCLDDDVAADDPLRVVRGSSKDHAIDGCAIEHDPNLCEYARVQVRLRGRVDFREHMINLHFLFSISL